MKALSTLKTMVFMLMVFFLLSPSVSSQGGGGGETAGNNLSFPVIFADGGSKVLPGTMGQYSLNGEWWYVWGEDPIDPQGTIYSCKPHATNPNKCEDGSDPGDGNSPIYKAYIQKDIDNVWQAFNTSIPDGEILYIDWIDWGDNLESVSWDINSKVRTEIALYEDIDSVTQFAMRHVDGWGISEVHGLKTTMNDQPVFGEGTQATIYTPQARFTIQKLNYTAESINPPRLKWVANTGWTETDPEDVNIINEPIFNSAASEAGTGPDYYGAEINVKGKIIYGYTWNVTNLNEGEGHYRLTFSFDQGDGISGNARFDEFTQIIVPIEEEETTTVFDGPGAGGVAILDASKNITYMDILIGQPGEILNTSDSELVSFKMYPNPTYNGIVNIKTVTGDLLTIYNIMGQEVFKNEINTSSDVFTIDVGHLKSGIYIVNISNEKHTLIKKLIIK